MTRTLHLTAALIFGIVTLAYVLENEVGATTNECGTAVQLVDCTTTTTLIEPPTSTSTTTTVAVCPHDECPTVDKPTSTTSTPPTSSLPTIADILTPRTLPEPQPMPDPIPVVVPVDQIRFTG